MSDAREPRRVDDAARRPRAARRRRARRLRAPGAGRTRRAGAAPLPVARARCASSRRSARARRTIVLITALASPAWCSRSRPASRSRASAPSPTSAAWSGSRSRASSARCSTALMVGGRVGAGITAELGSMQVTEQVDAIRSMGADPVQKLVLPRVLAATLALPLLTVLAITCSASRAACWSPQAQFGIDPSFYLQTIIHVASVRTSLSGIGKTVRVRLADRDGRLLRGARARRAARSASAARPRARWWSASIGVLVTDFFLTQLLLLLPTDALLAAFVRSGGDVNEALADRARAACRRRSATRPVLRGVDLAHPRRRDLHDPGRLGQREVGLPEAHDRPAALRRRAGARVRPRHEPAARARLVTAAARLRMVFQSAALFDSLTVYENVAYPLREHMSWSEERVRERVRECLDGGGPRRASRRCCPPSSRAACASASAWRAAIALEPRVDPLRRAHHRPRSGEPAPHRRADRRAPSRARRHLGGGDARARAVLRGLGPRGAAHARAGSRRRAGRRDARAPSTRRARILSRRATMPSRMEATPWTVTALS